MSAFYGTVIGSAPTIATRRGFKDIKVAAQSWDGSVITRMFYDKDGDLIVDLQLSDGSSTCGKTIFYGTFSQLQRLFDERKNI